MTRSSLLVALYAVRVWPVEVGVLSSAGVRIKRALEQFSEERKYAMTEQDAYAEFSSREGVIEEFSHRDHGTSRIVSAFVVGNCDDEAKAQGKKHLRSCVDAASGVRSPEAAVFH